jgi:hypothetical protein
MYHYLPGRPGRDFRTLSGSLSARCRRSDREDLYGSPPPPTVTSGSPRQPALGLTQPIDGLTLAQEPAGAAVIRTTPAQSAIIRSCTDAWIRTIAIDVSSRKPRRLVLVGF